jgi:long-chain acyl-CoA synthetase
LNHAATRGDRPATREKYLGIWQTWSWSQVAEEVRAIACGLAELGFKRGDNLAIIGDNRPRLYWSMCAAQMLGGVPVPMYQDAVAAKWLSSSPTPRSASPSSRTRNRSTSCSRSRSSARTSRTSSTTMPRGMRHYTQTFLQGLDEVIAMGKVHDKNQPDFIPPKSPGAAPKTSR